MSVSFEPIGNKCDPAAILQFETQYSLKLPVDYSHFLVEYNGGVPSKRAIVLPDDCIRVSLDVLFGIHDNRNVDIRFWTREWHDEIPEGFVVIGKDPCGAMYLLGTGIDAVIYFWDHQYALLGSSEANGNTFHIAPSFVKLLESLH